MDFELKDTGCLYNSSCQSVEPWSIIWIKIELHRIEKECVCFSWYNILLFWASVDHIVYFIIKTIKIINIPRIYLYIELDIGSSSLNFN